MSRKIDLIADIGEGFGSYQIGDDDRLLDVLTSANVACGFHAGDPRTMEHAVLGCLERGVGIGAHPGFNDRVGFGRRTMDMSVEEIRTDVLYQIGALYAFVTAAGATLVHVAPHGRLGNLTVTDERYATGVLDAIEAFDRSLLVVTQPGILERLARERGLRVGRLGFPDRAYEKDGTLVSRRDADAVLHDPELIAERAVAIATTGVLRSRDGAEVRVECDSLLLHGDNLASVNAVHQVRSSLEKAGISIVPMTEII